MSASPQSVLTTEDPALLSFDDGRRARHLRIAFWGCAVVLGLIQAWSTRFFMSSDGIAYLDIGDAFFRGNWRAIFNGFWGPLYALLLGLMRVVVRPSPAAEFPWVHGINFLTYLFSLAAFDFFLRSLIAGQKSNLEGESRQVVPQQWVWMLLGYSLFLWSSLSLITLKIVSPDMLMSGCVYLPAGILARIRNGASTWYMYALLGLVLGVGYWAKAPMFPLTFVFLGASFFLVQNRRKAIALVLVSLAAFLLIAAPFAAVLSRSKGRLTFGDSGRLNYLVNIDQVTSWYWQDMGTAAGKYKHPPSKIFDVPPVFEFANGPGGTQPLWYDPSYWADGAVPRVNLRGQLWVLKGSFDGFAAIGLGSLIVAILALAYLADRRALPALAAAWPIWMPGLAGLAMYSLVLVEARYVAVFLVLTWLGLVWGLRLPNMRESKKLFAAVAVGLSVALGVSVADVAVGDLTQFRHGDKQMLIAQQLRRMGVQPGDRVARIGGTFAAEWARLSRVSLIAEIPRWGVYAYWTATPEVKSEVMNAFSKAGAKVVVAQIPPFVYMENERVKEHVDVPAPPGWQEIGKTDYYVFVLQK